MFTSRRQFLSLATASGAVFLTPTDAAPLPRKDSFFGLHFDLHPSKTDTALGRDLTEAMIDSLLERVRPDFVQYDSKGHAGYLGFPSKTGYSAPGIVRDSLEMWRNVTARRNVALYIHFSGVWDSLAVERHPEWARVRPDAKPEPNQTSTFGPYVDELMIPELNEAAGRYSLDGAWIDGECWATNPDYSDAARKAFGADLPKSSKDPRWQEFLEFNREQFRRYVRHYIDKVHAVHPKFQIASNWLYSTFVPERPELPVDFLSGDYLGTNSISTARLEARYLAATGKPWDLMAWGFYNPKSGNGFLHKPAVQLQQEASVVLGQGGGFQIYYVPTRSGHIDDRHIDTAAEVARFCRHRQSLSHKSEPIPQIGVVFSKHSIYRTSNKLFGSWGTHSDPARGLVDALVNAHYSVDVIPDWKLAEVARQYPLIVVPDWLDIGTEAHDAIRSHVEQGGSALVCGAANGRLFASELAVKPGTSAKQAAWIPGAELFANMHGEWLDIEPLPGATILERRLADSDSGAAAKPAATLATLGNGRIAAIYGPAGAVYTSTNVPATRDFIQRVVARLFTPMVEVKAPPVVDVALRRKGARMLVHLSNLSGMPVSEEHSLTDFVPPVGPIELAIRLPQRPRAITWNPGATALAFEWQGGMARLRVPRVEIHGIVAIE